MTDAQEEPASFPGLGQVDELREDLDVAIQEYLERHPNTPARHIRQALRLTERSAVGARDPRTILGLVLLTAFVGGLALGLLLR